MNGNVLTMADVQKLLETSPLAKVQLQVIALTRMLAAKDIEIVELRAQLPKESQDRQVESAQAVMSGAKVWPIKNEG